MSQLLRDRGERDLPGPLAEIAAEHRFAMRVLSLLEAEVHALEDGRKPDKRLLREAMHFFVNVLDEVHHPREDLIFDHMERHADEVTRATTKSLRIGHDKLNDSGDRLLRKLLRRNLAPTAASRTFLAEELSFYVSNMRQHMRTEEAEIYEPARQLLRDEDWSSIEKKLSGLPNAMCGVDQSPEYEGLLDRYLNRVAVVSSGGLPYAWVNTAASAIERTTHTGGELFRLPGRLFRLAERRLPKVARSLVSVRNLPDATAAVEVASSTLAASGKATYMMLRESVEPPDHLLEAGRRDARLRTLRTEQELMTFGEQNEAVLDNSEVSWQAAGASLLFRTVLKPVLARSAINLAAWMRRRRSLSYRTPKGYQVDQLEGVGFRGRRVRRLNTGPKSRAILYLHGGAFVFPAANGHMDALTYLADLCDAEGLMVDYRLAPEHKYPAALDDTVAAYRYLLARGFSPREILVAGDSAGGGLTVSLMFRLREAGLPLPAAGACLSMFADLSFSGPSHEFNRWRDAVLPSLPPTALADYAGDAAMDDPGISPVYGDFTGLPPLLIQASSTEILLDDSLRVARKARAQGVDVQLEVWDSLPHAWHVFSFIPESREALRHISVFAREQFELREGMRPRDAEEPASATTA